MKIGIKVPSSDFLPFFINLANCLKSNSNEVFFLNPNWYMRRILEKNNQKIIKYEKDNFLEKVEKIDKFILWNGSFFFETKVLNKSKKDCFFIELGYFKKTLQINKKGVNAMSEIRKLSFEKFLNLKIKSKNKIEDFKFKKNIKIKYYFLGLIYLIFFNEKSIYNQLSILFKNKYYIYKYKKIKENIFDFKSIKKYIFFPLQVNKDTQIIFNSKYKSMEQIIKLLNKNFKNSEYEIIVKEHPYEKEKTNYSKFKYDKIKILRKLDLDKLIEKSNWVLTINSSVGLQAIKKYKKVLILGDCFYENSPLSFKVKNIEDINKIILENENYKIDKKKVDKYIKKFTDEIFVKSDFFNFEKKDISNLAKRILV